MKKVILSAIMGMFILAGTGLVLMAGETVKKDKASCCSSATTALADANAPASEAKEGCADTASAAKTEKDCADTASKSVEGCADTAAKAASGCADTAAKAASGCADTAAAKATEGYGGTASAEATKEVKAATGDCTKLPSGIKTSSAEKR